MESHNFDHFVITRFNLKNNNWNYDKRGNVLNDSIWLEERYSLFEKFCFPSLENQTLKTFKWLVFFDVDTPQRFRLKNEKLTAQFSNFFPFYVSGFHEFEEELCKCINKLMNENVYYVITTRLDNDDCLHKDTIKVIQQNFQPHKSAVIDLRKGLTLKVDKPKRLASMYKKSGPFISLISELKSRKIFPTIYDREHTNWEHDTKFIVEDSNYYWLQLIHNRNVSNNLGENLTSRTKLLNDFGLEGKIKFSLFYYFFVGYVKAKRKIKKALKE